MRFRIFEIQRQHESGSDKNETSKIAKKARDENFICNTDAKTFEDKRYKKIVKFF